MTTDFRKAASESSHRKDSACALVLGLFRISRPPTVRFFVPLVIINAFYRQRIIKAFAHIFQKVCKRVPSFANGYAPAAIILILMVSGIQAARSHASPRPVNFRESSFSTGISMHKPRGVMPPTTFRSASCKVIKGDQLFFPAFAATEIFRKLGSTFNDYVFNGRDYCELAEHGSNGDNFCRHNNGSFIVVFSGEPRLLISRFSAFPNLATVSLKESTNV